MKVVLLAGGAGTRISEESVFRPKPMVEIGGMPILWHIMKTYSHYGFDDFIVCAGYKQHMIKDWFANRYLHASDVTFDFTGGKSDMVVHRCNCEPWKVTIVDTGLATMTGGRIARVREYVGDEPFMMTYGDGVCDVNIKDLLAFHKAHGKVATLTAVIKIFDYLSGDNCVFEREPLERLAAEGELKSYVHRGFWQCMDNMREHDILEKLYAEGKAPWKVWE